MEKRVGGAKLILLQYTRKGGRHERAGNEMYSLHAAECKDVSRDKREHEAYGDLTDETVGRVIEQNKCAGIKVHPCTQAGDLIGYHDGSED